VFIKSNIYKLIVMAKPKSCNFSKSEVEVLVDEVESRREVLFGKLSSRLTGEIKKWLGMKLRQR